MRDHSLVCFTKPFYKTIRLSDIVVAFRFGLFGLAALPSSEVSPVDCYYSAIGILLMSS